MKQYKKEMEKVYFFESKIIVNKAGEGAEFYWVLNRK